MVRAIELRLSAVEFDACWELLGVGERPAALGLPSPGRTYTERRKVLVGVLDGLRRRGLASDRPQPVSPTSWASSPTPATRSTCA